MRLLRLALAAAVASCSTSYGAASTPTGELADASADADAGSPSDAADAADAQPDAAGGTVGITKETARIGALAVDATSIYWWSTQNGEVRAARKANPQQVTVLAARPNQSVTAMAADASGVYWLETGPDNDAGTSSRVIRLEPGAPKPQELLRSAASLQRLALDSATVTTTVVNGIYTVPKNAGAPMLTTLSLDRAALTSDAGYVFYTYSTQAIFRIAPDGASSNMITGLSAPRELAVDSTALYGVMSSGTGNTIFKVERLATNATASDATEIAKTAQGEVHLALDSLGIVWANVGEGTIRRVGRAGGPVTVVASKVDGLNALQADGDGLYWATDTGAVVWQKR